VIRIRASIRRAGKGSVPIFHTDVASQVLELAGLEPEPGEEWQRMLAFVGFDEEDRRAMTWSAEILLRRAPQLVVDTYDFLRSVPETAAILGWEEGLDQLHLQERRRFFAVWIARTIGVDSSQEFAHYLFRAGKFHAGHGPRRIHTPPSYVTGSVGLVSASIARFLADAKLPGEEIAAAMAGWSKYLSVQLHLMLLGYQVAREYEQGGTALEISLFGRLRSLVGSHVVTAHAGKSDTVSDVLRKFFNYYPRVRSEALERVWRSKEIESSRWSDLVPAYIPRPGWRLLLNGRNLAYSNGYNATVTAEDKLAIFPPGR